MKLGMFNVVATRQGDVKNVIPRGGYRACFHETILTNTVIKVNFGDLRAQQISAIIFQCGVLLYITQSSTFFDCLFMYVPDIDFCQFFSPLLRMLFSLNLQNKNWG